MILYHGSNVQVSTPKIFVTNRMLDFGAVFYTTSNRQQAVKWAKTQTIRRRKGKPIVSMPVISNYMSGIKDEKTALILLKPQKLSDQYAFLTEK